MAVLHEVMARVKVATSASLATFTLIFVTEGTM